MARDRISQRPLSDLDLSRLAWCRTGSHVIFLDLERDRYFRLPREREEAFTASLASDGRASWHQPTTIPRPEGWCPPCRSSPARDNSDFRLGGVARALWVQRRVEKMLASGGILTVLQELRRARTRCQSPRTDLSEQAQAMVRAFEQARLLRSAADRCLTRSIALAGCLAATGDECYAVLGVTALPFSAHCWAQQGDTVLNDSFEEVLRYTPILVA